MYHYINDKEFLKKMKEESGKIMQDFCHILKEEYGIGAIFYLVGSGARNLILQNESEAVDLDYNLEIKRCENFNDCHDIKEKARQAFNKALNKHGWRDCEDSTSSLSTKERYFKKGNHTGFSIDVCIVTKYNNDNDRICRLIHEKTGCTWFDSYYWVLAPNSEKIQEKSKDIKYCGKWERVRDEYKNIKNRYLQQNDHDHPSFICYIEAVNNVYNSINQQSKRITPMNYQSCCITPMNFYDSRITP